MADVLVQEHRKFTINAANAYILQNGQSFSMCSYVIAIVSSSFSGSISVKARPQSTIRAASEGPNVDTTTVTPVAILYKPRYLNGGISDEILVSTAVTGTTIITVDASGLDIVLDCTSFTSGSATVYVSKLKG